MTVTIRETIKILSCRANWPSVFVMPVVGYFARSSNGFFSKTVSTPPISLFSSLRLIVDLVSYRESRPTLYTVSDIFLTSENLQSSSNV